MRRPLLAIAIATVLVIATAPAPATADHEETEIVAFDATGDYGDDVALQAQLFETHPFDDECPCPEEGEQVDFLIDGEYVGTDITDEGGYADLKIDLDRDWDAGEHTITARFDHEHDDVAVSETDTATLTILEETTELDAHDGYLEAHLTDDEDDPLVDAPVNFTAILPTGDEVHVCTAFTDGDGFASCPPITGVGISNDLVTYRADYIDDDNHLPSNDTASWL